MGVWRFGCGWKLQCVSMLGLVKFEGRCQHSGGLLASVVIGAGGSHRSKRCSPCGARYCDTGERVFRAAEQNAADLRAFLGRPQRVRGDFYTVSCGLRPTRASCCHGMRKASQEVRSSCKEEEAMTITEGRSKSWHHSKGSGFR